MPANSTHPDYDANLPAWLRARDVFASEAAVKAAAEKYLPRLDCQDDEQYLAYKNRAPHFAPGAHPKTLRHDDKMLQIATKHDTHRSIVVLINLSAIVTLLFNFRVWLSVRPEDDRKTTGCAKSLRPEFNLGKEKATDLSGQPVENLKFGHLWSSLVIFGHLRWGVNL